MMMAPCRSLTILPASRRNFCVAARPTGVSGSASSAAGMRQPSTPTRALRRWPDPGACAFPCEPEVPALCAPALWLPALNPAVVILESGEVPALDGWPGLAEWPQIRALQSTGDGLHCVLGDRDGPHHIWLRTADPDREQAFIVPRDRASSLRHRASLRLDSRLAGRASPRGCATLTATAFQRRRLTMLLGILDALAADGEAITMHRIASMLVYPRLSLPRGSAWKSSNERRRTRRLVDEAIALRDGGYRDLFWLGAGDGDDRGAAPTGGGTKAERAK